MLTKSRNIQFNIELIFKILYFVLVLMSFNMFFARHTYLTYISYAVAALGTLVVIGRIVHLKDYLNKYTVLLIGFFISYFVSSIFTRQYGMTENVQAMVWMCLQYFVLFAIDKNRTAESVKNEFSIISYSFILYTFVCSIISFVMMMTDYWHYELLNGENVIGGFLWNRLWGTYTDPNYGAVFATISIILTLYFYKTFSKKTLKVLSVINIIFEFVYICSSDSRTGLVSLMCAVFMLIYLKLYRSGEMKIKNKTFSFKKSFKKFLISALVGFAVVILLIGCVKVASLGISKMQETFITYTSAYKNASDEEKEIIKEKAKIGRSEDEINSGDYSNKRFAIWSSAFDVFKTTPLVGTSFRNITAYAKDNLPNTYLAQKSTSFHSMHNFLVDIMVSQGILGLIIIAAFIILLIIDLFKKLKTIPDNEYRHFITVFSCMIAVATSMMFYSESFYMNTGGAFIFWTFLGYIANYYFSPSKKETINAESQRDSTGI